MIPISEETKPSDNLYQTPDFVVYISVNDIVML